MSCHFGKADDNKNVKTLERFSKFHIHGNFESCLLLLSFGETDLYEETFI